MCYRVPCVVAVVLFAAAFGASSLSAATTVWDFNNGNLDAASGYAVLDYRSNNTESYTWFGQTDGSTVPHIQGDPAKYMYFPLSSFEDGYSIDRPYSNPPLSSYTLLWDMLVPQDTFDNYSYMGIFNTNPSVEDDSELFIDLRENPVEGDPTFGRLFADRDTDNAKVYTPAGVIQPNTWHRIAFTYDENHPTEDVRIFVDGVKVGASDANFGHHIFRLPDTIPLFNDNDPAGGVNPEHAPGLVSSMALVEKSMTDAEITALGSANSAGFSSISDPGNPQPPKIAGSSLFANAMAASNPLVHFRLNEAAGAVVGDPVQNSGSFTGLAATWGLSGYENTAPKSGVQGPNLESCASNGVPLIGFESDNASATFTGISSLPDSADMLNLGNPAQLDLSATTWSFWMSKSLSDQGDGSLWSRIMITPPGYNNLFYVTLNAGQIKLVTTNTTGTNTAETSGLSVCDGMWHLITATRDGSDANNCRLYVDGEEVDLTTRNGNWAAGFSFRIGTMGTGSGQFKGLLDEIAIWDRVLSADEVAAIYNAAIGTPPEGTRPGDANCDGVVDQLDAQVLAENWLTTGAFWLAGDFNNDQVVNDIDATILAANWGYGASQSASAPEPSAIAMLLVMAAGFAAYGRRYL